MERNVERVLQVYQKHEMMRSAEVCCSVEHPCDMVVLFEEIVNGATRTMGTDSCGYEYAHIRQEILDLGREVLRQTDRQVNSR